MLMNYSNMSKDAEQVLDALGDAARRRAVEALREGPQAAGELAAAAGLSAPAMSRHLRLLLELGVVADERGADDARLRVFRLRPEPFAALQAWLDQTQALWSEQLGAFRAHVEHRIDEDAAAAPVGDPAGGDP
jgi:DNA-binding transcriptional ArsR family regulator